MGMDFFLMTNDKIWGVFQLQLEENEIMGNFVFGIAKIWIY